MKKKCLIFTTLFLISCTAMFAAPAPFESQVVKAFADSLYQEGFFHIILASWFRSVG